MMTKADRAYVEEFAAESADLLRRALAYSAQKQAEERARIARIIGSPIPSGSFNGRTTKKARVTPPKAAKPKRTRQPNVLKEYILDGKIRRLKDWCNDYDIGPSTVLYRLRTGMSFEEALKTPLQRREQKNTRGRIAKLHTLNGEQKTLPEWAIIFGVGYKTLYNRLYRGFSLADAVTHISKTTFDMRCQ